MKTRLLFPGALLVALSCFFCPQLVAAGSATWNLNPTSGDWDTAANWTPATVPDSPSDIATFDISNTTSITFTRFDLITANVVFNPGASAFTITAPVDGDLDFGTTGITNNSGITQNFAAGPAASGTSHFTFEGNATAGNGTVFTAYGDTSPIVSNSIQFYGGDAGTATFHATGGVSSGQGGEIIFFDGTLGGGNADGGTVILEGAVGNNHQAGALARFDSSATPPGTAGNATFTINGAPNAGGSGGTLEFGSFTGSNPTAGNATLIANGGTGGGPGGTISLNNSSTGGTARVELFGNGKLDIRGHEAPGPPIGSIEGDGMVMLGANNLTVGANKLSTAFSGVISGTGSLTKIGPGTLTLRGANTYTGKTLVRQGRLTIQDRTGSLMIIKGSITVDGGVFGGSGLVGGAVAVGGVSGRPSVLEPNLLRGGNFIIQKSLIFNPAATCDIDVNSDHGQYSIVWADSVTISDGALFTITDLGNSSFGGVNLVMINNTGSLPIAGEFSNLPEGGSITVGQNTFYATYHGGDGNDLLLTTVPP